MAKMDLQDVPNVAIVLMLVGIFFALAVIVLVSFQTNIVETNSVANESFTVPATEANVTLANTRLLTITAVVNSTGALQSADNYTISEARNGWVQFLDNRTPCITGETTCLISYTFTDYTTDTPVAITSTIAAMVEIPNNWLLLIAVIIAAAIIIGIVIKNLGGMTTRR